MTHGNVKAKRWRLWQFSLKSLLILMAVAASFFGGWVANAKRQSVEIERLFKQVVDLDEKYTNAILRLEVLQEGHRSSTLIGVQKQPMRIEKLIQSLDEAEKDHERLTTKS